MSLVPWWLKLIGAGVVVAAVSGIVKFAIYDPGYNNGYNAGVLSQEEILAITRKELINANKSIQDAKAQTEKISAEAATKLAQENAASQLAYDSLAKLYYDSTSTSKRVARVASLPKDIALPPSLTSQHPGVIRSDAVNIINLGIQNANRSASN